MQSRRPSPPPSPGLLEKGWLTYLLVALLIILVVLLLLSIRYQDEVNRFFRGLRGGPKKPLPPRTTTGVLGISTTSIASLT